MQFTPEERKRVHLIFTAHSLPKSIVENESLRQGYGSERQERFLKGLNLFPGILLFRAEGWGQRSG